MIMRSGKRSENLQLFHNYSIPSTSSKVKNDFKETHKHRKCVARELAPAVQWEILNSVLSSFFPARRHILFQQNKQLVIAFFDDNFQFNFYWFMQVWEFLRRHTTLHILASSVYFSVGPKRPNTSNKFGFIVIAVAMLYADVKMGLENVTHLHRLFQK